MRDEEFFATQTEILHGLADAFVEATPEWWDEATLTLEQTSEGCAHLVTSERHPHDTVLPTDEMYEATGRLEQLFRERGEPWKRVVFTIMRAQAAGEETWRYDVEYAY